MWDKLINIPTHRRLLLLSIAFILIPHMGRIPIWLSVFCLCLVTWRALFEIGDLPNIPRWLKLILTVVGTIAISMNYHALVGREAGSALLLLMLCLKLAELHAARDIFQTMFLGYFVVVVGFLFSQSIWMGIYMLVVILLITASLVAFTHAGNSKSHYTLGHYLKISGKMIAQALPVAVILFLLFPRLPGPLWSLPEDDYNARTGLSDTMSPGNVSRLTDSYDVAFRAKFDKLPENAENLYWRGLVLWYYDGRTWTNPNAKLVKRHDLAFNAIGERLNYTITLEPHDKQWLFAVDLPAKVPWDSFMTPDFQLMANEPVNQLFRYELSSYTHYQLARNNPPLGRYTMLPAKAAPRAEKLVKQWRSKIHDKRKIIEKALNYFKDEPFFYSRQPPLLPGNPVDGFLFETRKGFCEHFASSFTVLMRLAGIPARVVLGYHGAELNPISDYVIVRQSNAHAWSEVWLENQGWVRIDPTSVIPPNRVENVDDLNRISPLSRRALLARSDMSWLKENMRQLGFLWDAANNRWNQWVIGFNDEKQRDFLSWLGLENSSSYFQVIILAGCVVFALLIVSLYLLRSKSEAVSKSQKLYLRFCRKVAKKKGLVRRDNEGAFDFADRVIQQVPDWKQAVTAISDDYYRIRYAGEAEADIVPRLKHNISRL